MEIEFMVRTLWIIVKKKSFLHGLNPKTLPGKKQRLKKITVLQLKVTISSK